MQKTGRGNKGTGKVPYIQTISAKQFALSSKEMAVIMKSTETKCETRI